MLRKFGAVLLLLTMLFTFTSCVNGSETQNINVMPDYEKIQVWLSSSGAMIYTPENHEELVEYLRGGYIYN